MLHRTVVDNILHVIPPTLSEPSIQLSSPAAITSAIPPGNPSKPSTSKVPRPTSSISAELGESILRDVQLVDDLGWEAFVRQRRQRGDLGKLEGDHPANRLLHQYKHHGAPVVLSTPSWSSEKLDEAISRGPHRSCQTHHDFLFEEFIDMIDKGQWVVLPLSAARKLPGLRTSPPGVVEQRNRRPRWIGDYSFFGVNSETQDIAATESMQFGRALERFLRELLLADPRYGPIYLMKTDASDGFYRVGLAPRDCPKLGLLFPTIPTLDEPLVAIPLVLPMGWKNSPPIFSTATETVADVANAAISSSSPASPHALAELASTLDDTLAALPEMAEQTVAESIFADPLASNAADLANRQPQSPPRVPTVTPLRSPTQLFHAPSTHFDVGSDPGSCCETTTSSQAPGLPSPTLTPTASPPKNPTTPPWESSLPTSRDPCLPPQPKPAAYIDVFVDDWLALAQQISTRTRARRLLFHAIDNVFRPNDFYDDNCRRELISLKKLREGDCSWSTIKLILGWIVNTTAMTIELPPHRLERLADILASIPPTQKRTSVKKWQTVLGELRSMSLALPGSRNIFSQMQNALSTPTKTRIALKKGVHQALDDFRWMYSEVSSRPTRIAELIPLLPSALGFHDASGTGAGGVWFTGDTLVPRKGTVPGAPLIWRFPWPEDISSDLVTDSNPTGSITIASLELGGGVIHQDILAQAYDVRERTTVSKTDNLNTMFWERKGSCSSDDATAYLLRLLGIHQRIFRYVPRFDYQPGGSNNMADDASRLFQLSDAALLSYFNSTYPQQVSWQLVTPTPQMISAATSALRKKTSNAELLRVEPPPPTPITTNGSSTHLKWASTPYSKGSKTKYPSFKSSSTEFDMATCRPAEIKSSLGQLKTTYGRLHRRTSPWGPRTHGSTMTATSTFASGAC